MGSFISKALSQGLLKTRGPKGLLDTLLKAIKDAIDSGNLKDESSAFLGTMHNKLSGPDFVKGPRGEIRSRERKITPDELAQLYLELGAEGDNVVRGVLQSKSGMPSLSDKMMDDKMGALKRKETELGIKGDTRLPLAVLSEPPVLTFDEKISQGSVTIDDYVKRTMGLLEEEKLKKVDAFGKKKE